jgi:2-phospho-L-lactate guanylyltransferase
VKADETVTVVIPVKPWALGKRRLEVGDTAREDLARAFALDVIDAVTRSTLVGQTIFVTAERELRTVATRTGAIVLPDRPMLTSNALNVAVDSGRRWASMVRPTAPVIVIPADLPSLTTEVFDRAVARLRRHRKAFVPDANGQGTSLTWVSRAESLHTFYGVRSAWKHSAADFHPVTDVDIRARWDVDTRADLVEARMLVTGPHTTAVVDRLSAARAGRSG